MYRPIYGTRSALLARAPRVAIRRGREASFRTHQTRVWGAMSVMRPWYRTVLGRLIFPIALALAVFAAVSSLSPVPSALMLLVALIVLDVAALTVAHDSRDGRDWRQGPFEVSSHP
jgi:hypothetical protein